MDDMPKHGQTARRDHLWVAVAITACCLLEVWGSWLVIGSVSGFPKIGFTTGWILPVTTEGCWGYALWGALTSAPGARSKKFAMWTAAGMFFLSLLGQEAAHLLPAGLHRAPWFVVALVTALPLISMALVAVLVHLRQADREDAAAAARVKAEAEKLAAAERAEADERTWLKTELERVTAELADTAEVAEARQAEAMRVHRMTVDAIQKRADDARADADKATARVALLERKLAGPARRSRTAPAGSGTAPRTAAGTAPDDDLDLEARALKLLATNLDMSGAELAKELEISPGYGRKLRRRLAGDRPAEEEPDRGEDRTGTASGDRSEDRA
jgi:hypothetical protein